MMRLFSYVGWFGLALYILSGCGGSGTPVEHKFCVLAHPSKIGDERYTCTVTARFESDEACRMWEQAVRQKDPAPYTDGRLTTKCGSN